MKFIKVFFAFAQAYLYYPAFIGLFLWLYIRGSHWIYGFLVILAMFIFDPIWRIIGRTAWRKLREGKK